MSFSEGTAGIVDDGPVTAFANVIKKPANEGRFTHPDGAVHQKVQHLCHPDHVQVAHTQIGQLAIFTQQGVHLCRLVGQLHAGNVFVLALLTTDISDKPGHRREHHHAEDATGPGGPLQLPQALVAHHLHIWIAVNLRQGHIEYHCRRGRGIPVVNVVDCWGTRCRHQIDKTAVHPGEPPQRAVIEGFLGDTPEKNGGGKRGKQNENPETDPVIHLKEHAPAVGSHLPALGEVFTSEAHRNCPAVIASPERQCDRVKEEESDPNARRRHGCA